MLFRVALLYLFFVLWLVVSVGTTYVSFGGSGSKSIDDLTPITVSRTGVAYQRGATVAIAQGRSNAQTLHFEVSDSSTYQVVVLKLEKPVEVAPNLHFLSIQGTTGMSYALTAPTLLTVVFPPVLEGSSTSFYVQFTPGYFSLTSIVWLTDAVANVTEMGWISFGILLSAVTLLVVIVRSIVTAKDLPWEHIEKNIPATVFSLILQKGVREDGLVACIFELTNVRALELYMDHEQIYFVRHAIGEGVLKPYQQMLLEILAPKGLPRSSQDDILRHMSQSIYSSEINELYDSIYGEMVTKSWFKEDPRQTHLRIKTVGVFMQIIALACLIILYFTNGRVLAAPMAFLYVQYLAGFALYKFSSRSCYYSPLGWQIVHACYKLRKQLVSKIPESIENEYATIFYQYLPYAAAAGVTRQWASRFTGKSFVIAPWLSFSDRTLYYPQQLVDSLELVASSISRKLVAFKDPNVD